tara:strand:- start:594 stop:1034 length:441 start_codon:yes stop_codon:yes gene_type:complete
MAEELDEAVNDIITQLKQNNKVAKAPIEESILNKDDLEDFLIQNSGKLIKKSLSIVDNVNDYISSAPENRDVAALAELIKASSSAIETLNKLHTAKERNETQVTVKQMDVESKERLNIADNGTKLLLSRDDIMKALVDKDDDVIDV